MEFPKSPGLEWLLQEAQKQTGRKLVLRDIQEHPSKEIRNGFGRYEHSEGIIWLRGGLPSYAKTYVLAHELCHALQQAQGYPIVSLTEKFMNLPYPGIVIPMHHLANSISNIALDPHADALVETHHLLNKDALSYICRATRLPAMTRCLVDFDGQQFCSDLDIILSSAKSGKIPALSAHFGELFNTAIDATTYANHRLRFSPYCLFDRLELAWAQFRPQAQALGAELARVALAEKLNTPEGCKQAEINLMEHLQIPDEVFGIKAQNKWIWPHDA